MEHSAELNELATALSAFQGEMKSVPKEADNPYYKSKYADLAGCWDAARVELAKHGLAVVQTASPAETGWVYVSTTLLHKSGQWIRGEMAAPMAKTYNKEGRELSPTAQAYGAVVTYLRRFGLAAILGLTQDDVDDDGNLASGHQQPAGHSPVPRSATNSPATGEVASAPQTPVTAPASARKTPWEERRGEIASLLKARGMMIGVNLQTSAYELGATVGLEKTFDAWKAANAVKLAALVACLESMPVTPAEEEEPKDE